MPGAAATVLPRCAPPRLVEQNARLALGTPQHSRVGSPPNVPRRAGAPTCWRYIFKFQRQDNLANQDAPPFSRLPSDIAEIHTNFLQNCKAISFLFDLCEIKILALEQLEPTYIYAIYALDFTSIPARCRPGVEAWVISSNRTSLHARAPRPISRGPYLIIGGRSSVSAHRTRRGRNGTGRSICWGGTVSGDLWSMSLSGIFSPSTRDTPRIPVSRSKSRSKSVRTAKRVETCVRRFSGSQWIRHLRLD